MDTPKPQGTVRLMHATPLDVAINAMRVCHKSEVRMDSYTGMGGQFVLGPNDEDLIRRIIGMGHTSTLEHVVFNFEVKGFSRAVLQEWARHRIASMSVESTRYCLKRLLDTGDIDGLLVKTGDVDIDALNHAALVALRDTMRRRRDAGDPIPNDKAKLGIVEALKSQMKWSINARSLRNFLALRTSKKALWEIQQMARACADVLPEEYRILFDDIVAFGTIH